ncbi:porin [Escherichia coli]
MTGRADGVATYRNTDFFGLVNGLNSPCSQVTTKVQRDGRKADNGRDVAMKTVTAGCFPQHMI